MPTLLVENLANCQVLCAETETVLKNLQLAYIDWLQACGGKGRCTTCAMYVVSGDDCLTLPTDFEEKQKELTKLRAGERLACQCKIIGQGTVVVKVPERLKLPHLIYTDSN
jgi:ferredoxin, 2Fe-2S